MNSNQCFEAWGGPSPENGQDNNTGIQWESGSLFLREDKLLQQS